MPYATPADVLSRRRQQMLNMDTDAFADLFAPDAVMEFVFHGPPGAPPVRLAGREAIREYSRQFTAFQLRVDEYEEVEFYQTQDPEVVIVEMRTKATVPTTGRSITATSIQILRIKDGHIALFRDFADPRIFQDVMGDAGAGADTGPEGRVVRRMEAGAAEPAVMLEAGASNGAASWQRVIPLLAPHVRVAAYDRAGLGDSDPAPGLATIDRMIDDLASVITGLGARPCG